MKRFLSTEEQGAGLASTIVGQDVEAKSRARWSSNAILRGSGCLTFPKPLELLCQGSLISASLDTDDIVLDSFAGSGTTAHAVLALNAKDEGKRRFVLVQMQQRYTKTTRRTNLNICEKLRRNGYKACDQRI